MTGDMASKIKVGKRYTYFPPQNVEDNLHFDVMVVGLTEKRVRIELPNGSRRSVHSKRLVDQKPLFAEPSA